MIVMKSIIARILQHYRLETDLKLEELKIRMDINIFLLNGHMVKLYHRYD